MGKKNSRWIRSTATRYPLLRLKIHTQYREVEFSGFHFKRNVLFLEKGTYDDVLQAVRDGEAFAALVNSDIIRYKQDQLTSGDNPLAVVYKIDTEIPVRGNAVIKKIDQVWECVQRHKRDIIDTPVRKYYKHVSVRISTF